MILFLGDSFTWGQGLYITEWIQNGRTIEECNTLMPPKYPSELLSYTDDVYRKTHHFPNLVSKQYNQSYVTKFGNGGTNHDILDIIKTLNKHMDINGVELAVIQFTEFQRGENSELLYNLSKEKFKEEINEICESQINKVSCCLNDIKIPWIGLSWMSDIGDILSTKYPNNFIPILYKNNTYTNFRDLMLNHNETLISTKYFGINDNHINELGHQIISDSIISKMNSINFLFNTLVR